ncbi:sporulation protein [Bacillus sp. FJAT-49732]|uniref:Sporulation protein n=1 Tax=Lederbergia citrisecunda TaxID=2833583 RepID=A0A942TM26_9BACI|nr:sporulation protein [Lederbergia citrisecunda]MBS4198699.1 sporulation protein [Lederbergia citrisecunda]
MVKKVLVSALVCVIVIMGGCSNQPNEKKSNVSLIKKTQPAPIEINFKQKHNSIAFQVREEVKKIDEIYDVAVIEGDHQILVSYKVKHLQRFRMKKIEKNLTKLLNKQFPNHTFIVSSDYKIFLEAIRLKEDLEYGNLSNKVAKKRLNKIIKLKKEMT